MRYSSGWKYRLEEGLSYKLKCKYALRLTACKSDWWQITDDGWLLLPAGFCWDGATKFPDFDWILTPSAIHDALHQAIAAGAIPESQNHLIDKELELAIRGNPATRWTKRQMLKLRGLYVRLATHLVNEKQGAAKIVYDLLALPGEMPLHQFWGRSGR